MNPDKLIIIRDNIASAFEEEAGCLELDRFAAALAPRLHRAIALPDSNPVAALRQFIVDYVKHVPDFLQALQHVFDEAGLKAEGQIFLDIAADYFSQPPEMARPTNSLYGLIDAAYLSHRLIEEINDRLLMLCGCPLTNMDMTLSNIVMHDILGEKFANQLDVAVHYTVETLFDPTRLAQHAPLLDILARRRERWRSSEQHWPCLAGDSAIALSFTSGVTSRAEVH